MQRRSMERAWKAALALIASIAITMALYIQITERRSSQEAERASAARLESETAESRAEALERPSTEPAPEEPSDQPLPDTVLRRGESGGSALQKALDSRDARLAHLEESLAALERQAGQSDRALRRDLEELRTAVRREQDASAKVQGLLLVALIPLLLHLLTSFWDRGDRKRDEE